MTRPMIPRFEPEVIATGVRKFGDVAKVATAAIKRLMIHGIKLTNQMAKLVPLPAPNFAA
jgi:hypothetical protein